MRGGEGKGGEGSVLLEKVKWGGEGICGGGAQICYRRFR